MVKRIDQLHSKKKYNDYVKEGKNEIISPKAFTS